MLSPRARSSRLGVVNAKLGLRAREGGWAGAQGAAQGCVVEVLSSVPPPMPLSPPPPPPASPTTPPAPPPSGRCPRSARQPGGPSPARLACLAYRKVAKVPRAGEGYVLCTLNTVLCYVSVFTRHAAATTATSEPCHMSIGPHLCAVRCAAWL